MIQRKQHYSLTIPSLPAAGLQNVPLKLDSDAPFVARYVITYGLVPGLGGFRFRLPSGRYQSNGFRSDCNANIRTGSIITWYGRPLFPQIVYPADGTIWVDVENLTGAPITNARVIFLGSKLYRPGAIDAPTYPARASLLPFVYKLDVPGVAETADVRNIPLNIASDSDFAFRSAWVASYTRQTSGASVPSGTYTNLLATLRDANHKAYSNEPIPIDLLFTEFDSGTVNRGGLLWPEIYIPRNGIHYVDLLRQDTGGGTCEIQMFFTGSKVFHR